MSCLPPWGSRLAGQLPRGQGEPPSCNSRSLLSRSHGVFVAHILATPTERSTRSPELSPDLYFLEEWLEAAGASLCPSPQTPPPRPPPRNSQHSVLPWGSPSFCASITSFATFGSHCCFCVLHVANKSALPPSAPHPRRAPPANLLRSGPVSLNVRIACRTGIHCLLFYSGTWRRFWPFSVCGGHFNKPQVVPLQGEHSSWRLMRPQGPRGNTAFPGHPWEQCPAPAQLQGRCPS